MTQPLSDRELREQGSTILDALDLPEELKELQDHYWAAKRKWYRTQAAYICVAQDMLAALREGSAE